MVPTHCITLMALPNRITEPRMVKNFLVVVTMEQVRGPKFTTVKKMKVWQGNFKGMSFERAAFQEAHRCKTMSSDGQSLFNGSTHLS